MKFLPLITHNLKQRAQQPALRSLAVPCVALAKKGRRRGFTLIELLVVVAIIVVITGLILANSNKFGGQTMLQNLSYDIALSLREAQVYGISVRSNSGAFKTGMECILTLILPPSTASSLILIRPVSIAVGKM